MRRRERWGAGARARPRARPRAWAGVLAALVAAAACLAASSGTVRAADYDAGFTYRTTGDVQAVALTPDASLVVVGTTGGVALVNSSGTCLWSYSTKQKVVDVWISPLGTVLALTREESYFGDGELLALDKSGTKLWSISVSKGRTVSSSSDGQYLVLARVSWLGWCDEVRCWSEPDDEWVWTYSYGEPSTGAAAISASGDLVVHGVSEDPREYSLTKGDSGLRLVDRAAGKAVWKYTPIGGGTKDAYAVAISADGRYLAAGHTGSPTVYFFSSASGTPLWTYAAGSVQALSLSSDGSRLLVAASDKLHLLSRDGVLLWSKSESGVRDVAISAGGSVLVAGSGKQVVYYRDVQPVAQQAIANAADAIDRAKSKGVVVTQAEALLTQARTAYGQGHYRSARDLAEQAMNTAFNLSNQRTAAVAAIDRAASAVAQAVAAGIACPTAQSQLSQARTALEQADYVKAKDLAEQAERAASTLTSQKSAAQSAVAEATSTISRAKKSGVDVAEAESLLSRAKTALERASYTEAADLARRAKTLASAKLDARGTAVGLISDAEAAVEREAEAGYHVWRARSLLEEAKEAFAAGDYEEAIALAESALSRAVDIDQDGMLNAEDRFPTVNNSLVYGGVAAGVVLLFVVVAVISSAARQRHESLIGRLAAETRLFREALDDLRRLLDR
ncbi:MAG: hypothetical protein AB1645_05270 [Bacillota bacterium]